MKVFVFRNPAIHAALSAIALLSCAWSSQALPLEGPDYAHLPLVGVECIDQGSGYSNSGGGPVGDRDPGKGTGHSLVDDDGTIVPLDWRGNSIVVDLGQVQRVRALAVRTTKTPLNNAFRNLVGGNVDIYFSLDNRSFQKLPEFTESVELGEQTALWLTGFDVEARFMKVHSRYLGDAYQISGPANSLVAAYGVPGPREGERFVLEFGLLQPGENKAQVNSASIRAESEPKYQFQLWPYIRNASATPIQKGPVKISERGTPGTFTITPAPAGAYELEVEGVDARDGLLMWTERRMVHLVNALRRSAFPGKDPVTVPSPGEALIVVPGVDGELAKGWSIDRSNPAWPLWSIPANRVSDLHIPVPLSGAYAVYLGVHGSAKALEVSVGSKTSASISRAGSSPDAINEAFFGIFSAEEADGISIRPKISPDPTGVAYVKILSLTPEQAEVAAGKPGAFKDRKLIFYCDGYSIHGGFRVPSNFTAEKFEDFADKFQGSGEIVERFDFCQGTSSVISSHHSKIPNTEYPGETGFWDTKYSEFVAENFKNNYLAKGINPIEVMVGRLTKHGVPTYAGYRMNAWYDAPMDKHYVATYWREHPEFRVAPYRGTTWAARSYVYPEVRNHNLAVIKEMLSLGVSGLHLEFMRHPPFVGYDAPLVEKFRAEHGVSPLDPDFTLWKEWHAAQSEVITGYMREVRRLLDEEGAKLGKRFGLTARFDYRHYRAESLDLETWVKEGLVDALIPGDDHLRNRPIDLTPFQEMVRGTPVKVYSSLSPEETGTRDPTPEDDAKGVPPPQGLIPTEDMKGFVADAFRQGASGVYMFNNDGVGAYHDWRQFQNLEAWDIYENPANLSRFPYEEKSNAKE